MLCYSAHLRANLYPTYCYEESSESLSVVSLSFHTSLAGWYPIMAEYLPFSQAGNDLHPALKSSPQGVLPDYRVVMTPVMDFGSLLPTTLKPDNG